MILGNEHHRTVVFIDYQNVYEGAREAFFSAAAFHSSGQFDPMRLAKRIGESQVTRMPRKLESVRVYTGLPSSQRDPRGYGARMRQIASWERLGVEVFRRSLRYPTGWPTVKAEEKGIDVQLAIDFVMMKLRKEYDVGILFSTDTDLLPALEAVCSIRAQGDSLPEVCSWGEPRKGRSRLRVKGFDIRCHWLSQSDYQAVSDLTDYNVKPGERPRPAGKRRGIPKRRRRRR